MKQTLRIALLISVAFGWTINSLGQTTLTYTFNDETETKDWSQFQLGKKKTGWKLETGGIEDTKRIINYAPTGDADKDSLIDWYVSPELDLSMGGTLDSISYNYFTYFGTFFKEQSVTISLLVGDQDPDKASEIIDLADLSKNYTASSTEWSDTSNISLPTKSEACYLGFKFIAVDGWSSISFDNLQITLNKTLSAPVLQTPNLNLYPNPNSGQISILGVLPGQAIDLTIYSLMGEKIDSYVMDGSGSIQLDLTSGMYLYKLVSNQGKAVQSGKLQIVSE